MAKKKTTQRKYSRAKAEGQAATKATTKRSSPSRPPTGRMGYVKFNSAKPPKSR